MMYDCLQIDKQLASGEYFLQEKQKRQKKQDEKRVSINQPTSKQLMSQIIFLTFSNFNTTVVTATAWSSTA